MYKVSDADVIVYGIVFLNFIGGVIVVTNQLTNDAWEQWCVDNGYAQYRTTDKNTIVWKDCDNSKPTDKESTQRKEATNVQTK